MLRTKPMMDNDGLESLFKYLEFNEEELIKPWKEARDSGHKLIDEYNKRHDELTRKITVFHGFK